MIESANLRLAELLVARVCHDLAGPVGAIANGAELLSEDDGEFVRDAIALVSDSARRAASRLQFYRFAYGLSPSGALAGAQPYLLAGQFFGQTSIACNYPDPARQMPLDRQKLACNLLLIGAEALSRGGRLSLSVGDCGPEVAAAGDGAALPAEFVAALTLAMPLDDVRSRTAQAYFAGLLAANFNWRLRTETESPGRLRIYCSPKS